MQTQIRLNSVVPHGVSGPEAGAIDLIYGFLLSEFSQSVYSYISINQINGDLNEVILKDGKKIYVNIRYPTYEDFETKTSNEKNLIRLDIVHTALLRIAKQDKKLDVSKLAAIKNRILEKNFSFDFILKTYANKKNKNFLAKVIVHPQADRFDYYIIIEDKENLKCKKLIYSGKPISIYSYADFFGIGRWKGLNDFILTGKNGEVETKILIDHCSVDIINLTSYAKPPHYTLMKVNITDEEREKARKDLEHSMPPAIAANIRQSFGDASN